MFAIPIDNRTRSVDELPVTADGYGTGVAKEMNAVGTDAYLEQCVTNEALDGKVLWYSVHRRCRLTHRVTRGADGRAACDSKRRDRTNRRVDAVVIRHATSLAASGAIRVDSSRRGCFRRVRTTS